MNKLLALLPLLLCCACSTMRQESAVPPQPAGQDMQDVAIYAVSMAETPYRYGGNTPDDGFDCSGFVRYVFKQSAGLQLPRTSHEMGREGTPVQPDQLLPGDLVFFNTLHKPYSHVGIYIGDNRFVHAPKAGKTVTITDLRGDYWQNRYNGARRISARRDSRPLRPLLR